MTTNTRSISLAINEAAYVTVPVIRNIEESAQTCHRYEALLTAGPSVHQVQWGHPNHTVLEFNDTVDPDVDAPQMCHIEKIVEFAMTQSGVRPLIHCHAGMSRSTAAGIIYLLSHNVEPELAVSSLANIHPEGRTFSPNEQMIALAAEFFHLPDLFKVVAPYYYYANNGLAR